LVHTSAAGQALPQAPQLALSVAVLTHMPLQRSGWLVGQLQAPSLQLAPDGQTRPQPPQLLGSFFRLTQVPLAAQ
jgi:hypothetical protein